MLTILSIVCMSSTCQESLPPYAGPSKVYSLQLESVDYPEEGAVRAIELLDRYPMTFNLKLTNEYEETLTGPVESPLGSIEIWWDSNPSVKASLPVPYQREQGTSIFRHDTIEFTPEDSATFLLYWQWEYQNPIDIWTTADADTINSQELIKTKPIVMKAQAYLLPIPGGPPVYSNEFQFIVSFTKIFAEDDEG